MLARVTQPKSLFTSHNKTCNYFRRRTLHRMKKLRTKMELLRKEGKRLELGDHNHIALRIRDLRKFGLSVVVLNN
jgi:hypothetical protein